MGACVEPSRIAELRKIAFSTKESEARKTAIEVSWWSSESKLMRNYLVAAVWDKYPNNVGRTRPARIETAKGSWLELSSDLRQKIKKEMSRLILSGKVLAGE